jgi:CheY-like chemotaxis protein
MPNDNLLNIFKLGANKDNEKKPVRILLVDDNRNAALMLGKLLRHNGHTVEIAYDGDAALRIAPESRPDVIILDIGLPGKNGYEVAQLLKKKMTAPALFIALTGYGQDEDKKRAHDAGFDHHLTKPILVAEIEELIFAHQAKNAEK